MAKVYRATSAYGTGAVRVQKVDSEYRADLLVKLVDIASRANGDTKWYFTDSANDADLHILEVDSAYQADLRVLYVASDSRIGWHTKRKLHDCQRCKKIFLASSKQCPYCGTYTSVEAEAQPKKKTEAEDSLILGLVALVILVVVFAIPSVATVAAYCRLTNSEFGTAKDFWIPVGVVTLSFLVLMRLLTKRWSSALWLYGSCAVLLTAWILWDNLKGHKTDFSQNLFNYCGAPIWG